MRFFVFIFLAILLFGAEEAKLNYFKTLQERNNPYLFDKNQRLELQKAQLEAKTKEKMAQFAYKKAVDVEKIKKEAVEVKAAKEVEKEKVAITPKQAMVEWRNKALTYGVVILLVAMVLFYLLFKRYQAYKERMELKKMELQEALHAKEMAMKEKELQAQLAGKLIDAVSSGKLTKEQEEKLLQIATGTTPLLENRGD